MSSMTPEERFERIETNLERVGQRLEDVGKRLDGVGKRLDDLAERQDKFEVTLEIQNHAANQRFAKLEELQIVLMDAQNSTWAAVNALTANIEKLMRGRGGNGRGE